MLSRFLWYTTPSERSKINEALEQAIKIDKGPLADNPPSVVRLYEEAAKGHIAYAERRLGSLYAGIHEKSGSDSDFSKAVAYYVMAIEDGDEDYSYDMAYALTAFFDDDKYHLHKPHILASAAYHGDIKSRMLLAVYYWKVMNNPQRALESLAAWAKQGDYECLYNLADMLFTHDDEEYKANPANYYRFYQPREWVNLATKHFAQKYPRKIFDETLIVHSKENIFDIFEILKELLISHSNDSYMNENTVAGAVANLYLRIINESNSYVRGIDK